MTMNRYVPPGRPGGPATDPAHGTGRTAPTPSGRHRQRIATAPRRAFTTRGSAIGVTVTGLMIGGAAYFWQEVLGFFTGLTRKLRGEAVTLEKSEHLRRVA